MAQAVPAPVDPVILTISGDIDVTNVGDTLQFDRKGLESLGTTSFDTSTNWTSGVNTFWGVPLVALAELVGASSGSFRAFAINDYSVEIPVSDAVPEGPIIALLMNGQEMSLREKGPLWIVYPFDSSPDYRTEVIYSRSIWQLDRIEVVK